MAVENLGIADVTPQRVHEHQASRAPAYHKRPVLFKDMMKSMGGNCTNIAVPLKKYMNFCQRPPPGDRRQKIVTVSAGGIGYLRPSFQGNECREVVISPKGLHVDRLKSGGRERP